MHMTNLAGSPLHRRVCKNLECDTPEVVWSGLNLTITLKCGYCGHTMDNDCPDCPN